MKKRNKKVLAWVVVGILIVVGAILVFAKKNTAPIDTSDMSQVVEPESIEDTTTGSQNVPTAPKLSYGDAVVKYADRRIQLDKACQAHPNNVTYKNGTSIMIDNRSPQSVKVRLGGTFTVSPYSFKIVKLGGTTFPTTYLLDCGISQNVATILVQK